MKIHHKIANFLGYDLVRHKNSHLNLKDHLPKIIKMYKIDTIFDVGANEGQFGKEVRAYGFSGDIYSFEPTSKAFKILKEASENDEKWFVFNYALGNENKEMEINVTDATVLSSFFKPNIDCVERFGDGAQKITKETVEIKKLDSIMDIVANKSPRILLKMDTQGFDTEVFLGAQNRYTHIVALMSEVSIRPLYDEASDYKEALSLYEKEGYKITGMFPVSRDDDSLTVIEYDCIMVKPSNLSMRRVWS